MLRLGLRITSRWFAVWPQMYTFQMLLKDEPYTPFIAPVTLSAPEKRVLTPKQAPALLRSKGYVVINDLPGPA